MNWFAGVVNERVAGYESGLEEDREARKRGGVPLEEVRRRADGFRELHALTASAVEDFAGTDRRVEYAALKNALSRRLRFLVDWLVESVKAEAAKLGSSEERVAFLREQFYDLRSSGYGESDVGQGAVNRVGALLEDAERQVERKMASAHGPDRAVPPIPWRSSQTHLAIMLHMLYEEGGGRGITLPEGASAGEDLKFVDFLKRLLPAFVNAKTGEPFSFDGVQRHAADQPAYRVKLEEEVQRRRGKAPL